MSQSEIKREIGWKMYDRKRGDVLQHITNSTRAERPSVEHALDVATIVRGEIERKTRIKTHTNLFFITLECDLKDAERGVSIELDRALCGVNEDVLHVRIRRVRKTGRSATGGYHWDNVSQKYTRVDTKHFRTVAALQVLDAVKWLAEG